MTIKPIMIITKAINPVHSSHISLLLANFRNTQIIET